MKILLTGSKGTLASSIMAKFDCINFNKTHENEFIKLIDETLSIDPSEKKYILHFAAETDVDLCEKDKLHAINTNYVLTKSIVDLIKKRHDTTLVFTSSASIFDGKTEKKFSENDTPNPANFYALTKLLSEYYITSNVANYYILRFGWLIGNPKVDKKFTGKIFQQLIDKKKTLFGVDDVFGSLTFADDFASDLNKILDKLVEYGIYNYCSDSKVSRFNIITKIIDFYGLTDSVKVNAVSLNEFKLLAARPKYELLSNDKALKSGLVGVADWNESMSKYLEKYRHILDEKH